MSASESSEVGLASRLTRQALFTLGNLSVRWNLTDDDAASIAAIPVMSYLLRRNGYEHRPLPQEAVHRITALGLIDRALSRGGSDAAAWVKNPVDDDPFNGRSPMEVLPRLGLDDLTALNTRMGELVSRPIEYAPPGP